MSREWVFKTLVDLGFSQIEAEVYFFLAQAGPLKARDIAKVQKLSKHQLYSNLKSLQCKCCIKTTLEHPAKFFVVPLEIVLDHFMKEKMGQAMDLQASRERLLFAWRSMTEKHSANITRARAQVDLPNLENEKEG
jgi:sugar-specific transcriptional regulator TrmB